MKKIILLFLSVAMLSSLHSQYITQYTATPTGSISGTGNLRVNTQQGYIDIGPTSTSWCQINTGNPRFYFNKDVFFQTGVLSAYSSTNLTLATSSSGSNTVATPRLTIVSGTGNVGIGTQSPLATFHSVGQFAVFSSTTTPTFSAAIRGNNGNSAANQPDFTWYNNDQTGIYHPATDVIGFTNAGSQTMRIDANGKVVIGGSAITNIPGNYKLYVTGGILTEQVRVAVYNSSSWADYVFEKDYKLMELDRLNSYIKENKHLPNIPSTSEVMRDGVNLGEMDAKLLEKVEELTLYIIDLQQQIDELKKQTGEKKDDNK